MYKIHKELLDIFKQLKIESTELNTVYGQANNKLITELIKELEDVYNHIANLTQSSSKMKDDKDLIE